MGFAGFLDFVPGFSRKVLEALTVSSRELHFRSILLKRQSQGQVFMELDVLTRASYSMFRWNCGLVRVLFLFQRQGYV